MCVSCCLGAMLRRRGWCAETELPAAVTSRSGVVLQSHGLLQRASVLLLEAKKAAGDWSAGFLMPNPDGHLRWPYGDGDPDDASRALHEGLHLLHTGKEAVRTTKWCLYMSPTTSLSPLTQPIFDGRQRERCSSCATRMGKLVALHTMGKASKTHTQCQDIARKVSCRSTSAPTSRRGVCFLPFFHSPQRFSQPQSWILQVFVPQFLPDRVPIYDILLAGPVVVRVASSSGLAHFPQSIFALLLALGLWMLISPC